MVLINGKTAILIGCIIRNVTFLPHWLQKLGRFYRLMNINFEGMTAKVNTLSWAKLERPSFGWWWWCSKEKGTIGIHDPVVKFWRWFNNEERRWNWWRLPRCLCYFRFSSLMYCIISNRWSAGGLVSVPAILRKSGQRSVSCMAEECILAYRRNILCLSFLFEDHLLAFEVRLCWYDIDDDKVRKLADALKVCESLACPSVFTSRTAVGRSRFF